MKSIYKVQGKFEDIDFKKMLNKLSERFYTLYFNDTLFIGLKSIDFYDNIDTFIKKIIKPTKSFLVTEITTDNMGKLNPVASEWLTNILVMLDKEQYERDNQEKLQQVWKALDKMEQELTNKQLQPKSDKEGG